MTIRDKEKLKEYKKRYYQEHKKEYKENSIKHRELHREELNKYNREYHQRNREKLNLYNKERAKEVRAIVLNHYGGKCACCGEITWEFLALDHTDGGGCQHRKSLGINGGNAFYLWVIKNNFPDGFRVLCHNCNSSFAYYGYCPHQNLGNK